MAAPGRADQAQHEWYSQFDQQYSALLQLRSQQQPQPPQHSQPTHSAQATPLAHCDIKPVKSTIVTAAPITPQRGSSSARPQSSQSNQRRRRQSGSRRTYSDFPHVQQHPIDRGMPAEFEQLIQQESHGKQRATEYKKERAREKAARKAEEETKRAEHRAKMRAIQLRSPGVAPVSALSSPAGTPQSARPTSRRAERPTAAHSPAVAAVQPALEADAGVSSAAHQRKRSGSAPVHVNSASSSPHARHLQSVPILSAAVVPLPPIAATTIADTPNRPRPNSRSTKHTRHRTPTKKHPATAVSAPPDSASQSDALAAAMAPRESLRSMMREARRRMQRPVGAGDVVVLESRRSSGGGVSGVGGEVCGDGGRRSRGSMSEAATRRASCEFNVVFASAAASPASSPTVSRRGTLGQN